jgi:Fibronectin type III domain
MTRLTHRPKPVLLAAAASLAAIAALVAISAARSDGSPSSKGGGKPVRLEEATMIIEVNATDGDAGLQVFLDGEPWTDMTVTDPDGKRIAAADAKGKLNKFGLTELFSESNEPEFSEMPLNKFKKRFPAGKYRFSGTTIEGRPLVGSARFSHDTPAGPEIISPTPNATVPDADLTLNWNAGQQPSGIDLSGYRVIVEREDPLRIFQVEVPASVTSMRVPAEYLEPNTQYKFELQAIEESGNQTISELEFRTG